MKNSILLILVFILFSYCASAQLCFTGASDFSAGNNSYSIASGDFNGDGNEDLAIANYTLNSVSVLLGTGTGSFSAATDFAVGTNPYSLISADFNGDGKMDLATANQISNNVSILLSNGASFLAATNFTVGSTPYSIEKGDFNGDGKVDLATANISTNNVTVLLGNGLGGFSAATNFAVGTNPTTIISGDFNGDGKLDLATGYEGAGNISVLSGNGAGSFSTAATITKTSASRSISSADFNGDGKSDLVTSNGGTTLSVLLANNSGGFSASVNLIVPSNAERSIGVDINGDGKMDIVTSHTSSSIKRSVLLGNGSGSFSAATTFNLGTNYPYAITCADFNKDSKLDIAGVYLGNANVVFGLLDYTVASTNVSCKGNNTGTATATVSCGTAPFTYSWNTTPVQTTATATSLVAGTYTVTVTDADNASKSSSVTITEPANALSVSPDKTDISCTGVNDGTAWANVSGGTGPYTYSWNTSPVKTTSTISGLTIGTYTVTVTDSKGCTQTASVTVGIKPAIVISPVITNVSCYAGNNGSIVPTVSGGTGPYNYSWNTSPVQTSANIYGLVVGSYTLTVTDSKTCTKTQVMSITQPASALAVSANKTDITCKGLTNGTATASASGGTPPYTYSWNSSPVQTTAAASNLSIGLFTVTVTDSKGCKQTSSITITEPAAVAVSTTKTDVTCNAGSNGMAIATASGGTSPYSYSWNSTPVQNGATANNLVAGTYIVTVTDSKSCSKTANVIVTEPSALTVSTTKTDVSCNGGNNGTATGSVAGGIPGYTYSWNTTPVQTTASANNLLAGNYSLLVTDSKGCTKTVTTTIGQPAILTITTSKVDVACKGQYTGSASATVTGGTGPYTYSWDTAPKITTSTANNLNANNYVVTVTDSKGCIKSASVTINEPPTDLLATVSKTDISCNGGSNGAATVTMTNGVAPYTYSWDTSPTQTTATANNLTAREYMVVIADSKGCMNTSFVTIAEPPVINISTTKTNVSCSGANNGTAAATVTGGTSPYSYSWNTTPTQSSQTANNLIAGSYQVNVTDSKGCSKIASVVVAEDPNPISFTVAINGMTATFSSSGSGCSSYNWDLGNGTTSTLANPSITYVTAGTYNVCLQCNSLPAACKKCVSVTVPSTVGSPTISSVSPSSAAVGSTVTITGTNLTGATSVKFNNVSATSFNVISPTSITATVPSGASTGKISITTPAGTAISSSDFTVSGSVGTIGAAVMVKDIIPGINDSSPINLTSCNGSLFFFAQDESLVFGETELWKSDGTAAGTVMVKDINPNKGAIQSNTQLVCMLGNVYFIADDGTHGIELWKSDGTEGGTVMVNDIRAGALNSRPENLTVMNDKLYFAADNGINGNELWKTDGTSAGTMMVKDIRPESNYSAITVNSSSAAKKFLVFNNNVFFSAQEDIPHSDELWKSDGTAGGTGLVKEINTTYGSYPGNLTEYNGQIYFTAKDEIYGEELWKSDGTDAGTTLVKDINPGVSGSYSQKFKVANGLLFFVSGNVDSGLELWRTDGTAAGTKMVKDIRPGSSDGIGIGTALVEFNGILYFSASDGVTHGGANTLWKSDGTAEGTVIVKDIYLPIAEFFVMNSTLFFAGDDGVHGSELWKSDGTTSGTTMVQDIFPAGITVGSHANPGNFCSHNNELYFTADDGVNGRELWKLGSSSVGINDPTKESPFKIYPNPVKDQLMISSKDNTMFNNDEVVIMDIAGKALLKNVINGSSESITISQLPSGIYFVNVGGSTFKIIKE